MIVFALPVAARLIVSVPAALLGPRMVTVSVKSGAVVDQLVFVPHSPFVAPVQVSAAAFAEGDVKKESPAMGERARLKANALRIGRVRFFILGVGWSFSGLHRAYLGNSCVM